MALSPFEFGGHAEGADLLKIAQSKSICLNPPTAAGATGGSIIAATLSATETLAGSDTFTWYLTADGGSNWEQVTNGTRHVFTNTGSDLRWKAESLNPTGGANTYFELVKVRYEVI